MPICRLAYEHRFARLLIVETQSSNRCSGIAPASYLNAARDHGGRKTIAALDHTRRNAVMQLKDGLGNCQCLTGFAHNQTRRQLENAIFHWLAFEHLHQKLGGQAAHVYQ